MVLFFVLVYEWELEEDVFEMIDEELENWLRVGKGKSELKRCVFLG